MKAPSTLQVVAFASAAWLAGCGGATSSSASQPTSHADASADASDADAGSGARDAACKSVLPGDCPWTPCTNSVAAACASGFDCVMNWPSNVSDFCSLYNPTGNSFAVSIACGPYRVFSMLYGDIYYYSLATGRLVAIVNVNGEFQTSYCVGGPSNFVVPTCDMFSLPCPDGGVEAGAP